MSRAKSKGNRTSLAKTPIGIQGLDEVTGGVCCFICLSYGGEGEIRTPDSLSTMPDFESGVVCTTTVFTILCRAILWRCYLECHINLWNLVGAEPGNAKHSALNRQVVGSIPTASTKNQLVRQRSVPFPCR